MKDVIIKDMELVEILWNNFMAQIASFIGDIMQIPSKKA